LDGPVACGGGVAQPRQFGFAKLAWLATPPPHWLCQSGLRRSRTAAQPYGCAAVWRGRSHSTPKWSGYAPATQQPPPDTVTP